MKAILQTLAGLIALTALTAAALWLAGLYVAGAVVASMGAMLVLLFIILLSMAVGSWWTLKVEDRAAARIQNAINQNDNWDSKKTAALSALLKEGVRLGASNAPRLTGGMPPLPLPGQVGDWLTLPEPIDGDYTESED